MFDWIKVLGPSNDLSVGLTAKLKITLGLNFLMISLSFSLLFISTLKKR